MDTDDLRTSYGKTVTFNCKDGDEAFTDNYVLWLENQLITSNTINTKKCYVIRNDIGIIKRVALLLSDEDKERYRKIKWYIDECDLF